VHAERLFLRSPEQWEIQPAGEADHGEVGRLAAFESSLSAAQSSQHRFVRDNRQI
jgi:hypothetical protein